MPNWIAKLKSAVGLSQAQSASPSGFADEYINLSAAPIASGSNVLLQAEVALVQTIAGEFVSGENLGIGLVIEQAGPEQFVVRWDDANLVCYAYANDLIAVSLTGHLITIMRCSDNGSCVTIKRVRSKVSHDWRIELRSHNVVRAIRSDDLSWVFTYNTATRSLSHPGWEFPPEDEDAEAITAAEMARK